LDVDLIVISLGLIYFFTAVISVVTGGTSLITVPVMMEFGIDPRVAVATNMLALTFLSLGGTLPFLRTPRIPRKRLPVLVGLTLVGSLLGAVLLLRVSSNAVPLIIAAAMLTVAGFSFVNPLAGMSRPAASPTRLLQAAGLVATFLLGIYGGFYSGGYVLLLTAAYVWLFRMELLEAVATTKVLNFCSSLVASIIFARQGLIDWNLGIVLVVAAFLGGLIGAALAQRLGNAWLRRVFLLAVVALGLKTLLVDVHWTKR
jgi:uncharacterized protein